MPWPSSRESPAAVGGRGDQRRGVVVDAQDVDRPGDDRHVAVVDQLRPVDQALGVGDQVLGVRAVQHRPGEDPVAHRVDPAGGVRVGGAAGQRADVVEVEGDRDLRGGGEAVAQDLGRPAVGEVEVVGGAQRGGGLGAAGGVHAGAVAEEGRAPRFVEGGPGGDPVAEDPGHDVGVVGEAFGGHPLGPAARVLQVLGQVPVVEGGDGCDARFEEFVDEPAVEVQAAFDGGAAAGGLHPGPGDGEAVGRQAEPLHQHHVVAVAVVVVGGDVSGVPAEDLARGVAEGVPDGGGPAVLGGGALDLVGGGGRPPDEAGREIRRFGCGLRGGVGSYGSHAGALPGWMGGGWK